MTELDLDKLGELAEQQKIQRAINVKSKFQDRLVVEN